MQPLSGNQRPDLLTCHRFWTCYKTLTFCSLLTYFDKVHNPVRLPRETTSEPPKVVRACGAFNILISKCASRHNAVHFFDISTSKSGLELVCFVHFDFEMCFAPQRRALFRHLPKVVRTWCALYILTSKCGTFSTSQLPRVVRSWCALYILTSKCASRHNPVHDICQKWSGPGVLCTF